MDTEFDSSTRAVRGPDPPLRPLMYRDLYGFGALTTGLGLTEDLKAGVVDRFRSLPIARSAVLIGRTVADLAVNVISLIVMLPIGVAVGFRPSQPPFQVALAFALVLAFAYVFSSISASVGLSVRDPETAQSVGFIWVFPLVFASSAFEPTSSMPGSSPALRVQRLQRGLADAGGQRPRGSRSDRCGRSWPWATATRIRKRAARSDPEKMHKLEPACGRAEKQRLRRGVGPRVARANSNARQQADRPGRTGTNAMSPKRPRGLDETMHQSDCAGRRRGPRSRNRGRSAVRLPTLGESWKVGGDAQPSPRRASAGSSATS